MAVAIIIAGAVIVAIGTIGAALNDTPDSVANVYPQPSPTEVAITRLQLEAARTLRGEIDDPRIMEEIYSQLPAGKMNAEDRAKFTSEFAEIKGEVMNMGAEQSKMAMGEDLQSLVDRGVISQDSADKQKIKSEAAINSVMKIYNKKLDAARIGMARSDFINKGKIGLNSASVLANVDMKNRQIYNSVMDSAMRNITNNQTGELDFYTRQAIANFNNEIGHRSTKAALMRGAMSGSMSAAGGTDWSQFRSTSQPNNWYSMPYSSQELSSWEGISGSGPNVGF